jgi:hypothetical protein
MIRRMEEDGCAGALQIRRPASLVTEPRNSINNNIEWHSSSNLLANIEQLLLPLKKIRKSCGRLSIASTGPSGSRVSGCSLLSNNRELHHLPPDADMEPPYPRMVRGRLLCLIDLGSRHGRTGRERNGNQKRILCSTLSVHIADHSSVLLCPSCLTVSPPGLLLGDQLLPFPSADQIIASDPCFSCSRRLLKRNTAQ